MKTIHRSYLILLGTPKMFTKLSKNLLTSFVSVDLQFWTTGLCYIDPFRWKRMVSRLQIWYVVYWKNQFVFLIRRRSIPVVCFFSVDGKWDLNLWPELMNAVHVLHLISMSFLIPDHQIILLSARVFPWTRVSEVQSVSTVCFFSSSGITILSPANNKLSGAVSSLKTEKDFSVALSFWISLTQIFSCGTFRSTDYFCLKVFNLPKKLNSAFIKTSSVLAFFVSGFSITWLTGIYCIVFLAIS